MAPFQHYQPRNKWMPDLTELQLAALAAIRDGDVEKYDKRVGYRVFIAYRTHGHDITCQSQSLRKRRLIRYDWQGTKMLAITDLGLEELAKHPEF